ncbi:MAG: glycosyl transferase [Clostridium sp.]|nr:glycosyl transferase [Prevotella sp.]MCM1429759.1 glycosyl transferase [Clostridium sp.]MCM1474926.1 glycosyl transferase [Muribaculaceae bacterium]
MNTKIPKVIHYCWFGGKPLPASARRCIESWRKFLPDYEIRRWDESNYDINGSAYAAAAYADKKYAYVSDIARMEIIYKHGGIYFDTDVELIADPSPIIARGAFMGSEHTPLSSEDRLGVRVAPGLGFGAEAGNPVIGRLFDIYKNSQYENPDGKSIPITIVIFTTKMLKELGLRDIPGIQEIEGMTIYPVDYFCPISIEDGELKITSNTVSIHYYDQTWQSPSRRIVRKLLLKLGGVRLKKFFKRILLKGSDPLAK